MEDLHLPEYSGVSRGSASGADRYARLLLEAARHIDDLERGLMGLARLPVQAHAARLGLLHELLGRCGHGLTGELKVAAALRTAAVRESGDPAPPPPWELAD
jgi:hypothetical protein